jgi:hypothetical protein
MQIPLLDDFNNCAHQQLWCQISDSFNIDFGEILSYCLSGFPIFSDAPSPATVAIDIVIVDCRVAPGTNL